jgi:hypothetical protein
MPRLARTLRNAAAKAGFPPAPGDSDDTVAIHMTRCLLTRPLADGYQFLGALGVAITNEQRRNLFHLVAPGWVSPEAASRLKEALNADPPRACIVNAERVDFTPEMYLRRARLELPQLSGRVVGVTGVTASLAWEQLRRTVRVALAAALGVAGDPSDPDFDAELSAEITGVLHDTGRPFLVAVPVAESDLDLVQRLCADPTMAGITFFALCSEAGPSTATQGLEWLDPGLQPNQEDSAFRTHNRLIRSLP